MFVEKVATMGEIDVPAIASRTGAARVRQQRVAVSLSPRHGRVRTLTWLLLDYLPLGAQSTLQLGVVLGLYWRGFVSTTSMIAVGVALISVILGPFRISLSWKALFVNIIVAMSVMVSAAVSTVKGTDTIYNIEIAVVFCIVPLMAGTVVGSALGAGAPDSETPDFVWLSIAVLAWLASAFFVNPGIQGGVPAVFRIGAGSNPQGLALDLVSSSLAVIPYIATRRARLWVILPTVAMVFAAGSRGALVGYIVALVVAEVIAVRLRPTALHGGKKRHGLRRWGLPYVGVLVAAVLLARVDVHEVSVKLQTVWLMGVARWSSFVVGLRGGALLDTARDQLLQDAWSVFRAHPAFGLFGYEGASGTYAHNLLAGTLSEQGLVGAFSIAICLGVVLYGALGPYGSAYRSRRCLVAVLWLVAAVVNGLVVGTLLSNTALWVAVGILVGWPKLSDIKPIR